MKNLKKSKCCGAKIFYHERRERMECANCYQEVSSPKKKERRIKAWAIVYDDESVWAFFTSRMEALNACRTYQTVVPCEIIYKL